MTAKTTTAFQWQLWLIIFALGAPLPLAWAAWYWKIGIPDQQSVHGQLLPAEGNIFDWSLMPLGKTTHVVDPVLHFTDAEHWYLLFNCQESCRDEEFWRIHRALGRDADRLIRYVLVNQHHTNNQSSKTAINNADTSNVAVINSPSVNNDSYASKALNPLPGSFWWYRVAKAEQGVKPNDQIQSPALSRPDSSFDIWLADPSGRVVLAYSKDIDGQTLLRDIRKVLRRNPEKPSWYQQLTSPPQTSLSTLNHFSNDSIVLLKIGAQR